ncbi:ribonuclease H-like domain-containing protein [Tanacetum coccineum]
MSEAEPIPPTSSVTALRIPMIKKGEYDLWSMKMRQYIAITDHILWDIITNGDQATTDPTSQIGPVSAQKLRLAANARRNNEKALNILLSAIPDRHLLSFHDAEDAKTLWSAIKARFGGNEASKKMQKNLLKQQFETFTIGSREELDSAYERFQNILSPLIKEIQSHSKPEIDRNKVIIEDWVDSDDEETALNFSEIQKKTVLNSENSETSFENRIQSGYVAFGNDSKGGRISGKGTIKTSCLDFEKVSYVEELKFNLLSISQIYDKKHNVLFTDKECLILSPKFKFVDEDLVILRAPRKNDVYRTPQQNGVAERKNRTLIEAARTMLADSLLPNQFWAEAVNTACYVLNRVLVTKPQMKTP